MMAEQQGVGLAGPGGGLLGWLRRLFAGAELDALQKVIAQRTAEAEAASVACTEWKQRQADAEARTAELEKVLEAARSRAQELEARLAAMPEPSDETDLAPLQLAMEQSAREQAELEKTIAKKESERRDASAKLTKMQLALESLEKKLQDAETRAESAARATKESTEEIRALRALVARLERRSAEVESALADATREQAANLAARDERIAQLEKALVDALAGQPTETALERALRERDALVEELEIALLSTRVPP